MEPQTKTLLQKSAEDEAVILIAAVSDSIFAFHAQQTIEKLLKALLAQLGTNFPKTHDLNLLEKQLTGLGEILPPFLVRLSQITPFATIWRYDEPPPGVMLDRPETIETVRILREFVHRRVMELDAP
jgi:HEPN domain-containing protein